jgi:5'(3')-deoxyribonucleotidase
MKTTVYIDMDDTLCDFTSASKRDKLANPKIGYPQSQYGFFVNLKPLPGAIESVRQLEEMGYDVWILTRPSYKNPLCYTEKRMWIENHLGLEFCNKLILHPDKGRAYQEGDILIDDYPWDNPLSDKLTPWRGEFLQFGKDAFSNWESIIHYFIWR